MISTPARTDEVSCEAHLPPRVSRYADPITIGLVNNMPDAALLTTERQFRDLLSADLEDAPIRLRLFSLPELPRAEAAKQHISEHYEDIRELWTSRVDGLIVTGTEPRAKDLRHEPYWASLARLVDWAEENGISTVWSCLAAHAAVLHLDRIDRRSFAEKLSGVFECVRIEDHKILAGTPVRWRVPHSRFNDLPEKALVGKGYSVLSRSSDAGADIFIKQRASLAIFLQGHPEYDPGSLLREYRRDIGRYLAGARDSYPAMPRYYFSPEAGTALAAFRAWAERRRCIDALSGFPMAEAEKGLVHHWRNLSVGMYTNWKSWLRETKISKAEPRKN